MLTYRRPFGSQTERMFIEKYITPLPGAYRDAVGNWHVEIPNTDGSRPKVLWSCHTDTVARKQGRQAVELTGTGYLRLSKRMQKRSNCLGADDTVGVFLCREMILAGRPGRYIFHYGEEVGGIGSSSLAQDHPEFLQEFDMAIAFDRRGTKDVITHQGGGRCASNEFAQALADQLNALEATFVYKPSDCGIYTDTAEYTELIPECTNLSVGYEQEHWKDEHVDAWHVMVLRSALLRLDTTILPIKRDPAVYESRWTAKKSNDWKGTWTWDKNTGWKEEKPSVVQAFEELFEDDEVKNVKKGRWYEQACDYIDPEWEEIQRVILRGELEQKKEKGVM